MDWIEIKITSKSGEVLEYLAEILSEIGIQSVEICDFADFDNVVQTHIPYWDFIDENEYDRRKKEQPHIKAYVSDNEFGKELCEKVVFAMAELKKIDENGDYGELSVETRSVNDEDWANNWKQYYKPFELGERFIIKPEWEVVDRADRVVINLDPGRLFGTGMHQTTQLCLCALEKYTKAGNSVLDLGCGSGILAIGAKLLGAGKAVCVDIDPNATETVEENAKLNDIDDISVVVGDVAGDKAVYDSIATQKYDIITANIVADVIIAIAPTVQTLLADDGVFIASGIIAPRSEEVIKAIKDSGLVIKETAQKDDWMQITAKLS
ncbi:MAG: 50S ribosomal protein L11 methyltransferase [Ruminococcaceae bacterium]|nr:50S ribosomal protein L11 methyltransferase [Oscillospiraceae bacterium]